MIASHRHWSRVAYRALSTGSLIAATVVGQIPGPSAALADEADPDARLEIILKNVHVFDDNDWWFAGEITLNVAVYECKVGPAPDCISPDGSRSNTTMNLTSAYIHAASDEYASLNDLTLPDSKAYADRGASSAGGFEVSASKEYGIVMYADEEDLDWTNENGTGVSLVPDHIGAFNFPLRARDNWSIGNHVVRSLKGTSPGDYDVAFEIRRKVLPDLTTSIIGLRRLDDGRDAVCFTYGNVGPVPVGTFGGQLRVDDVPVPGGTVKWPRLAVDESRESCVVEVLPLGRHTVSFDIDPDRNVPELDEKNNHIEQLMTITSAASTGSSPKPTVPDPGPGAPPQPAALSVSSIRVGGENVAGTSDCDAGKQRVTIRVENELAGQIDVTVRLIQDDDLDTTREQVGILLNRQQDVVFENVQLDKGERSLTARVLSTGPSDEEDDADNRRRITFSCKD